MAFDLTEQIEKHLVNDRVVWLTTVTPSGRPAPRPVWFLWDGDVVTTYSMPDRAKLKHIAANDQVSLHFNCTPDGGDVVVLSGRAQVINGAPPPSAVPGLLDKYIDAMRAMGYTPEWYDTYNTAIRITLDHAWSAP